MGKKQKGVLRGSVLWYNKDTLRLRYGGSRHWKGMGKNRMKRKAIKAKLAAAAVLVTAAGIFAACGNKENVNKESENKESEKAYIYEVEAEDYVKVGEYKGIKVVQAKPEITDEYRDAYMNYLLTLNPKEGVKEGDTVNIDYVGKRDGVAFEGGTASRQNLVIGSGRFIPGFEEGLIGAKTGDTLDLNLTFPENYDNEELAGKEVVFTVTVNAIMAAEPQELNEEYVQGLDNGCNTVEEYKQYVYDNLYEEEMAAYDRKIEEAAIKTLMENSEFVKEPPQAMLDRYAETLTANLTAEAENYGMNLEQFMQLYYGMDTETYPEEIKNQALASARQYLMLKVIADKEDLNVSEQEVQEEMEKAAAENGYDSVEEFKERVNDKGYREYMMGEKVMDMLRENAVVTEE